MLGKPNVSFYTEKTNIKLNNQIFSIYHFLVMVFILIKPELIVMVLITFQVLSEHMYSMAKCIEVLGIGCLNNDQMTELVRLLDKALKEHFERSVKRQEQRKDEDYDEASFYVQLFINHKCFT